MSHLAAQPWLTSATSRALLAAFAQAGHELRFVGGCVRDALLGRPVHDMDCATPLPPQEVMALLQQANIKAVPTGIEHGTITAIIDSKPYEITTLRRDIACDGRHAEVAFTDNWQEDASRRDFTMNALYCDAEGNLSDFFGGVDDAKSGRVRFIGDAQQRITEDALRMLRFFRFYASHGSGAPDAQALTACHALRTLIDGLSAERIQHEMRKLFCARDPRAALLAMQQQDILTQVADGMKVPSEALSHLLLLEQSTHHFHPWLRLALCLRHGQGDADAVAKRWRLSHVERTVLVTLCEHAQVTIPSSQAELIRVLRRTGQTLYPLLLLRDGGENGWPVADVAHALTQSEAITLPTFPISGADLKQHGYTEGKALGDAMRQLETRWEESDYTLTREALLALLAAD